MTAIHYVESCVNRCRWDRPHTYYGHSGNNQLMIPSDQVGPSFRSMTSIKHFDWPSSSQQTKKMSTGSSFGNTMRVVSVTQISFARLNMISLLSLFV